MKCLILNGSLKRNGDTARIIEEFVNNYDGEVEILNVFNNISPCLDCGFCSKHPNCCIKDNFSKIVLDDYQTIVVASPIYMSNLPGPMLSLISRFNYIYNNQMYLNIYPNFNPKNAVLLLVGGGSASKILKGEKNETNPINQAKYIFKKLNANFSVENMVLCLNTDEIKVKDNLKVLNKVALIASNCKTNENINNY